MLLAVAKGYGPKWLTVDADNGSRETTVKLVKDDVPIEGRIIDLEGRPLANISVRISGIMASPHEDLTPWIKAVMAAEGSS